MRAVALAFAVASTAVAPADAQVPVPPPNEGGDLTDAVRALEEGGHTVIVVPPEPAPVVDDADMPPLTDQAAAVRAELSEVMASVPELPEQLVAALRLAGDGSLSWMLPAAFILAAALVAGLVAYALAASVARRFLRAVGETPVSGRAGRIAHALSTLAEGALAALAFYAAGSLATVLIEHERTPAQVTALSAMGPIAVQLASRAVINALLAPHRPQARLVPLGDALAKTLAAQLTVTVLATNLVAWLCFWMAWFPLPTPAHQLLLIAAPTFSVLLFSAVVLMHVRPITAAILGGSEPKGAARRVLAALWPVLAVGYFVVAWAGNVVVVAFHSRLLVGPILAPTLALLAALVVSGLLLIALDRRLRTNVVAPEWARLLEGGATGLGVITGAVVLAALWRLHRTPLDPYLEEALGLSLTGLAAWIAYRAVAIWVALRLAEEQPEAIADQDREGFGQGASRLATLLPIVRNVIVFAIAAVFAMVALASLGVDVAPLFAGAGVVGLAIGFGAQSLIRDVFSGAFFLLDDAFRRGEYVEVSGVAGQVEKISVRSFQLRHHEGALHTVPFGEIRQLTNFSRDWVIMKLPLRLTYDTDVETVRRLVKELGRAMQADPELGPLFLEPPKSQGVVQMEDSAMILRVKFKSRPGDQFLLRRHVYQRLREVFQEHGIRFAHREVTVRVADGADDDTRRRAAAGASQAAEAAGPSSEPAGDLAGVA